MDERLKFIARLLDGDKMGGLCREFGVSRKTGYKILARYNEIGLDGLTDRSRRPRRFERTPTMTKEQKIIRAKVGLLELAKQLGNVSQACKMMGYSRDSFYRFKELYDAGGELALQELTRRRPILKNRTAPDVEAIIVELSLDRPAYGQIRIANEVRKLGHSISPAERRCAYLIGRLPGEIPRRRLGRAPTRVTADMAGPVALGDEGPVVADGEHLTAAGQRVDELVRLRLEAEFNEHHPLIDRRGLRQQRPYPRPGAVGANHDVVCFGDVLSDHLPAIVGSGSNFDHLGAPNAQFPH